MWPHLGLAWFSPQWLETRLRLACDLQMTCTCIIYSHFWLWLLTGRVILVYISVWHNNTKTHTNAPPPPPSHVTNQTHPKFIFPCVNTLTHIHTPLSLPAFPNRLLLKVRPGSLPLPSYTASGPRPSGGQPAPAFILSASQPDASKTLLPGAGAAPGNMTKAEEHWAWQFTGGLQYQAAVVQTM